MMSAKSCLTTVMSLGRMTIMEQGWRDASLPQRLTETRCSSPLPVTSGILTWTTWDRTASIVRLRGNRPSSLGTWASILGSKACTVAVGVVDSLCAGVQKIILKITF